MISYELAMGLSIIALVMMSGSLSLKDIVESQHGINWNIWYQPLGFLIFLVCAYAECNRSPFDLPECETELVGGYHTEYSSMKLGFYLFAEYINMFISSAMISTLYFGGYNFPFMDSPLLSPNASGIIGTVVFFVKIAFFGFLYMWIRWTVPRFRYDQLMNLGWKKLIPIAILNMLITGFFIMLFKK
jgi:NADH-quinone oxidoreductase subunit H